MEGRTSTETNATTLAKQRVWNYTDAQVHDITTSAHNAVIELLKPAKVPYTGGQIEFVGDTGAGSFCVIVTEALSMDSTRKKVRRFFMTAKRTGYNPPVFVWTITKLP